MKVFLLYPGRDFDFAAFPPNRAGLTSDLELATLLQAMAGGDKFRYETCEKVLLASLTDPGLITYRQDILADAVAHPQIIRALHDIAAGALADKRSVWGFISSQNPSSVLSAAVNQLEVLTARLRQLRTLADEHASTFRSAGMTAFFRTVHSELDDTYLQELDRHLKQLRFTAGTLISARLAADNSGIDYILRSGHSKRSWRERAGLAPKTVYSFAIPPRDEAGAQALTDLTNRGLNHVANAAAQSADHVSAYFTTLRAELAFYISCLDLHEQLTAAGTPVTYPEPQAPATSQFSCYDLRDTCLTLTTSPVTGNDIDADTMRLVVITGANSGGKSTFLRSVGLAHLMMQCGMFVTARHLRASACTGIFTHFIREEDPAMSSGRLDEELARMSAIADQITAGGLILFNESFAATNEREGSEISRQVITALLEAGIKVMFVTHHYDLADSLYRQPAYPSLFLRAPRQPDGQRDYKLAGARPLPTSYGQDIYHRIGGW